MSSDFADDVISSVRIVGKDIFSKTSGKIIAGAYGTEDSTEAGHETAGEKKVTDKICYGYCKKRSRICLIFSSKFKSVFRGEIHKVGI